MEDYSNQIYFFFNFTSASSLLPYIPVIKNQKLYWGEKSILFVIFCKLSFVNVNSVPLAAVELEAHIFLEFITQ